MMEGGKFAIRGRIINKEENSGVFALKVVFYDKDHLFDDFLGSTWTNAEGEFVIQYREEASRELFEKAPDLYVEVLDCRNATLHSSEDAVRWDVGKETVLHVELPRARLAYHLANLSPLPRLTGGLVAHEKLQVIDRAVELLESHLTDGRLKFGNLGASFPRTGGFVPLGAAYCPAPDIFVFEDLLDIAWAVISNDVLAIPRYVDVLGTIMYRYNVRKPEQVSAVSGRWTRQPPEQTQDLTAALQVKRAQLSPAPSDTLIETDRILPVLAAAVIAAGGDTAVENRYLSFLLGQIGALGQLDKVYRAARAALGSNPNGLGSFGNMLRHVGGTCGPDDGPVPWPLETEDWWRMEEVWRLEKWQCTAEMSNAVRHGMLRAGRYVIRDVDWSDGCPGSPVIITGENFSGLFPDSNRVLFTHRSGMGTAEAAPAAAEDWTDTRIEVTIPEEAGPGPVSLSIVGNFATACGRGLQVPRRGNSVDFGGGAAYVRVFTAEGRRGEFGVAPGVTVTLRWLVVPSDATMELRVEQDGTAIVEEGVAAEGWRDIAIPAGRASLTVCTLTTTNACSRVDTRTIILHGGLQPALEIVGVEVTQAIQYYRAEEHLTDPADRGPDNSIQLVVAKPALVRVYVRSGLPTSYEGGRVAPVTGTLDVERIEGDTTTLLRTLTALPVTVEADYLRYADERGNLNTTLNFLIPANLVSGRLRLSASVTTPAGWFSATASAQTTVDVTLGQTLQVAGIMVSYNGPPFIGAPAGTPNLVLAAPTLADLQTTAAWMLAAYPVRNDSVITFRIAGTVQQTVPLQDPMLPPGQGCSVNWNDLMADLRDAAALDAPTAVGNWVYYGLLANGMPIGSPPVPVSGVDYVTGCGGDGVGAGGVGRGTTMAHEVGHALGLQHAPCGGAGNPDPSYPAYEPYDPPGTPTACTGEYGFEFLNGLMTIHAPTLNDFMSYCGPEWVSLHNYDRLLDVGLLTPTRIPAGMGGGAYVKHGRDMEPQPLINLIGFLGVDDVQVHTVSRLVTRPSIIGGSVSDLTVELLDKEGKVISSAPAYSFRLEGPGQVCPHDQSQCRPMIQALVPNVARGASLRILRGKDVLWQRQAPPTPVIVKAVRASIVEDGSLEIEWDAEVAEGTASRASVRWSNDGGKTWHGLAVGLKGRNAQLGLAHVPGGKVTFEVMVSDGFDTTSAVSAPVRVPHKPPTAAVLSPAEGIAVRVGGALRLWAVATDQTGQRLPEESCTWLLDRKVIGSGTDLIIEVSMPGEHRIAFQATDLHGTSEVIRTITVEEAS